jgi:activator of 2-hydroxyglutaryl-CoA dehydratase
VKQASHSLRVVFLRGGVALNRAVGPAFAHILGRQIVIPQNPELFGASVTAPLRLGRRNPAG